ncbi:MAG: FAD-dependent oxidoreductase [Betaproteobacteria bacterium]
MPTQSPHRMAKRAARILLVGGGHSHVEVLRRFALEPDAGTALTLVSPDATTPYSGMLPGTVAGLYTPAQASIDLVPLTAWAGARFIRDEVVSLDLYSKTVSLATGNLEAFDFISIDIGSTPPVTVPGAHQYTLGVKPVPAFLAAWDEIRADAASGKLSTIAVVGGGAGGVEVLLAMQYRLHLELGDAAPRFALITDQSHVLAQHAAGVRARMGRILVARGVVLHLDSAAIAVERNTVIVKHGRRIAADRIIWATGAAPAGWLAASGLGCDAAGFIAIDADLKSVTHPFVFAAGDCASQIDAPRPKSGVFAVRQGPPLAANLRRVVHDVPLHQHRPQRHALALISTGNRHAIASWTSLVVEGDWVWRWKDWVDRVFMAKYVPPKVAPTTSV